MVAGKCDVCGALTDTIVCCSACGGMSFAYCKECLKSGAEPWDELVYYISIAGHYPDEINNNYRDIVKNTCKRLGKSEDDFANAVNEANSEEETLEEWDFKEDNDEIDFSDMNMIDSSDTAVRDEII